MGHHARPDVLGAAPRMRDRDQDAGFAGGEIPQGDRQGVAPAPEVDEQIVYLMLEAFEVLFCHRLAPLSR